MGFVSQCILVSSPKGSLKTSSHAYRSCNHDGDRLASSTDDSELNSAVYQCNRRRDPEIFSPRR